MLHTRTKASTTYTAPQKYQHQNATKGRSMAWRQHPTDTQLRVVNQRANAMPYLMRQLHEVGAQVDRDGARNVDHRADRPFLYHHAACAKAKCNVCNQQPTTNDSIQRKGGQAGDPEQQEQSDSRRHYKVGYDTSIKYLIQQHQVLQLNCSTSTEL